MTLSRHGDTAVVNVKGPFEGLSHQTLAGSSIGNSGVALWQHHMIAPLRVPAHYHPTEEVVVVLSGTLRFYLGIPAEAWQYGLDPLAAAEIIECGPEATAVIPASQIHAYDIIGVPARVLIFMPDAQGTTLLPGGDPLPLPWH